VYDNDRVVRVLNEDQSTNSARINQTVVDDVGTEHRVNDLSAGTYDVVVTTGPSYSTKRTEAADALLQLVQAAPKVGEMAMDIIVKSLDFPGSDELAERFRKMLPPGMVKLKDGEEPPPQEPTPEQLAAQAEQEANQQEAARKDKELEVKILEMAAKVEKIEEETGQIKLENLEKAFEISMATGELQSLIKGQVQMILNEVLAPDPPPQPTPMAQPIPPPAQPPPTNGAGPVQ